jgi:hypothetical protein
MKALDGFAISSKIDPDAAAQHPTVGELGTPMQMR